MADCADNYPHPPADDFSLYTVLSYLCNSGVCDEVAYPKDFCYEPHPLIECKSGSIIPNELVSAHGYSLYSSNINQVKQALISNGPLISGWHKSQVGGHGMVLVGYRTIHEGDSIYYYNPHLNQVSLIDTIGENNPIVGATYWIFKNSYGDHPNGGYYHILFPEITENGLTRLEGLSLPASFQIPISTLKYTDNDIAIVDEDGDGYYNWGIGPKPASCPVWIPDTSDGDDSDPTKHLMDSYGNYPETYSFPMGTEYLNTNRTISGNESLMKDIDISHGTTLTITGSAYCLENVKINNYGGTLIIDGGVLANADIVLHSPCTFIIRNGGTVYMKKNKNLVIPVGCVSDIEGGEIRGPFERK